MVRPRQIDLTPGTLPPPKPDDFGHLVVWINR
jgi:hypothetical protein